MKLSFKCKRADAEGRHNDRNFDVESASHIDMERSENNKYYTYNGDSESTFRDIEYQFYMDNFFDFLQEQNKRNMIAGHRERNRTMQQYYSQQASRPEDVLIQIGNVKDHVDGETLWAACMEYKEQFEKLYGDKCKILTMALHEDEATPHVHIRRVWLTQDENNHNKVNQTKALEELGIQPPEPSQPISRTNNAKTTFTMMERASFRELCKERGIELEPDEPTAGQKSLTVNEYKLKQIRKDIATEEANLREIKAQIKDFAARKETVKKQLSIERERAKNAVFEKDDTKKDINAVANNLFKMIKKSGNPDVDLQDIIDKYRKKQAAERLEYLAELTEMMNASETSYLTQIDMSAKSEQNDGALDKAEEFIDDYGLTEEYREYLSGSKDKDKTKERDENDW